jgi:hypothetical protein
MHKTYFWYGIVLAMVLCSFSAVAQQFPDGPYFGQKQPGLTPELFTPGFSAFTPDQKECFLEKDGAIYFMKVKEGHWTGPFIASFLGNDSKGQNPGITADGKILYYNIKGDLWISNRKGNDWSAAEKLPDQINSGNYECAVSFLKDGSVYYASGRPGTKGQCDIFFSSFKNGRYDEPANINVFNTPGSECMVCVSPNEDYIISTGFNRSDGLGSADMYISFLAKDSSWSIPQHLGPEFNTDQGEGPISFSPDGKYLFFGRSQATGHAVYWIDVKAFEQYRPDSDEK